MSITHITEDHIFRVIGRGRDPKYKPIDLSKLDIRTEPFNFKKLLDSTLDANTEKAEPKTANRKVRKKKQIELPIRLLVDSMDITESSVRIELVNAKNYNIKYYTYLNRAAVMRIQAGV